MVVKGISEYTAKENLKNEMGNRKKKIKEKKSSF